MSRRRGVWSRLLAAVGVRSAHRSVSASAARDRHASRLMAIDGVVSVGVGLAEDGAEVVVVGVADTPRSTSVAVPSSVDGVAVEVRVVGHPRADGGDSANGAG